MEVIMISTLTSAAAVVGYALWKQRTINEQGGCPACGSPVPALRHPRSLRQAFWGGWTCDGCGTEFDRHGRILSEGS